MDKIEENNYYATPASQTKKQDNEIKKTLKVKLIDSTQDLNLDT